MGCATSSTARPGFHHDSRARWEQRLRDVRAAPQVALDDRREELQMAPNSGSESPVQDVLTQIVVENAQPEERSRPPREDTIHRRQRLLSSPVPPVGGGRRLPRSNPLAASAAVDDDSSDHNQPLLYLHPTAANAIDPEHSRDCGSVTCIFDEGSEHTVKAAPARELIVIEVKPPLDRNESVSAFSASAPNDASDLQSLPSFAQKSLSFRTGQWNSPKELDRGDSLMVDYPRTRVRNCSVGGSFRFVERGSVTPTFSAAEEGDAFSEKSALSSSILSQ